MKEQFHPTLRSFWSRALSTTHFAELRLTSQVEDPGNEGTILDQDIADLDVWCHRLSRVSCEQAGAAHIATPGD
jgi:hypothetical protein